MSILTSKRSTWLHAGIFIKSVVCVVLHSPLMSCIDVTFSFQIQHLATFHLQGAARADIAHIGDRCSFSRLCAHSLLVL